MTSSKIKLPGRLLLPASLEEIGKACGDFLLQRISDDSWVLGIWLDGYSDTIPEGSSSNWNPPDAILCNDGHLAVLQGLDDATVRTEIERRLGANLPARGTA